MSAKEILTLQFGHYPNYIGTHWWNIQEAGFNYNPNDVPSEINHDVLYREGLTSKVSMVSLIMYVFLKISTHF